MDIYELEANIDNLDKENVCPIQAQSLVIAKPNWKLNTKRDKNK